MSTVELPNDQWSKVLECLQSCPDLYVGQETDCRQFIEAVLWMSRSGAQWRLLPECYGNWNSIYKRFARWCGKGIWERMHQQFLQDPDMENLIIDSTIVRTHPCAAEPRKKGGSKRPRAGAKPGWVQHQSPRERGWAGQPIEIPTHRGSTT